MQGKEEMFLHESQVKKYNYSRNVVHTIDLKLISHT